MMAILYPKTVDISNVHSGYTIYMSLRTFDLDLIHFFRSISIPVARVGLFTVYFWFGLLKVIGLSPASPLVQSLFERTMPIMSFETFIILFGLFECIIGLLFLLEGAERVVIPLLTIHLITTVMPLFLLVSITWSGFMTPTLEGQYIIKNVLIIAAAIGIAAHIHPLKKRRAARAKKSVATTTTA
jgi:hypothetical protein